MSDPAWKKFERLVGTILEGSRFWANSGESLDCEGPRFVAQCKLVKTMSLGELTTLAGRAELDGRLRDKLGVAAVKLRRGAGYPTPILFVMTEDVFKVLIAAAPKEGT